MTHYGPTAGLPELREAIAEYFAADRGLHVDPERVPRGERAPSRSCSSPILALLRARATRSSIPNPASRSTSRRSASPARTPVPLPLREERRLRARRRRARSRAHAAHEALILNSPAEPDGRRARRRRPRAVAGADRARRDAWVLSDEIYGQLLYDGDRSPASRARRACSSARIVLDGFSKTYAMTGWRCGYAAVPEPLVEPLVALLRQLDLVRAALRPAAASPRSPGRRTTSRRWSRSSPPARPHRRGPERAPRRLLPQAARRVLRVPERDRHARERRRAGPPPARRGRRGRARRDGVRRRRRRLPALLVRQLAGEPPRALERMDAFLRGL